MFLILPKEIVSKKKPVKREQKPLGKKYKKSNYSQMKDSWLLRKGNQIGIFKRKVSNMLLLKID